MMLGLSLAACAQSEFVDEGSEQQTAESGNLAKSMLIKMGAIDDPNPAAAPKFQPRPPLVLPPQRTLPTPVDQDAALASKGFPVDPEVRAEKERQERLKLISQNANGTLSLADQEKFKDLPVSDQTQTGPRTERDGSIPLKPWELDGKAQADALAKAQASGPGAKERSLLAPPADYRTPSSKAPLESPPTGMAAMKPSWWPF